MHPVMHPDSQENPLIMGCAPHSEPEAVPTFIHSYASMMEFPPLRGIIRSSADGMYPYSEDRVCTLLDGMCPRMKVLTQTSLRAFLSNSTEAETLHCENFPTQSPYFVVGMCPLSEPLFVPLIGCALTRNQQAYSSPHLNLRADEPPIVSLYRVPSIF